MRTPSYPPDCILMSRHRVQWPLSWGTNIEGPNKAVNAGGSDDGITILIPVVREGFSGRRWRDGGKEPRLLLRGMDRNTEREVIGRGRRGPKVEQPEVRVRGDRGEEGGRVGRESR